MSFRYQRGRESGYSDKYPTQILGERQLGLRSIGPDLVGPGRRIGPYLMGLVGGGLTHSPHFLKGIWVMGVGAFPIASRIPPIRKMIRLDRPITLTRSIR